MRYHQISITQPLTEDQNGLRNVFPDPKYGIGIIVGLGIIFVTIAMIFLGCEMMLDAINPPRNRCEPILQSNYNYKQKES